MKQEIARHRLDKLKSTLEKNQGIQSTKIQDKSFKIQVKHARAEEFKDILFKQQDDIVKAKSESKKQRIEVAQKNTTDFHEDRKNRY